MKRKNNQATHDRSKLIPPSARVEAASVLAATIKQRIRLYGPIDKAELVEELDKVGVLDDLGLQRVKPEGGE